MNLKTIKLIPFLLLALNTMAQAQYNYTINDGSITITKYTGSGGDVVIPSEINGVPVTSIGPIAFYWDTSLTSVTIPNSVTSIGLGAFYLCENLTSVTIPGTVTSNLGEEAFMNCFNLANVTIENGVTSIADQMFVSCFKLTNITIPNTVTSIGNEAFEGSGLIKVTIPASVTNIEDDAFNDCTSLAGIYFQGNAPSVGSSVFSFDNNPMVYYLPGTSGWGFSYGGCLTALWLLPNPQILNSSYGLQNNGFGFTIFWATNTPVVVEACTNLDSPAWRSIQTNTIIDGLFYFSDPQWSNFPARFYRLRWP